MSRLRKPFRVALVSAAAALVFPALPAFSQSTANPPTGNAAATSPTSTQPEASPGNSHKANAKAARAQRKAELNKLEKQGYQPSATEPNYPDNVQNAEKKANSQ